jgi:hypothetical protein
MAPTATLTISQDGAPPTGVVLAQILDALRQLNQEVEELERNARRHRDLESHLLRRGIIRTEWISDL